MSYPIVNRRPSVHAWWAFNTDDHTITKGWGAFGERNPGWFGWNNSFAYDHRTIVNNGITNPPLHNDEMLFFIEGAVIVGPWTIHNGDHQVITPNDEQKAVVSVEAAVRDLYARIHGQTIAPSKAAKDDDTLDKVMQVAIAVLGGLFSAVSSGISVPSPGGKPGFGAGKAYLDFMGGILQQAGSWGSDGDSEGPPAPPDIDQIKTAVTDVVQVDTATKAATLFAENYDYFSSLGRQIVATKGSPPQPLVDRFDTYVERALDPTNDGSFASRLAYTRDNPSVCRWILPEYITATGLYLTLSRMQFARTYIPDSGKKPAPKAIPAEAIQSILDDTNQLRTGLDNARKSFINMRNDFVNWSGLSGTPESIVLIKMASKHYLGDEYGARDDGYATSYPNGSDFLKDLKVYLSGSPDPYTMPQAGQGYPDPAIKPDPIKSALDKLDTISKSLAEDLTTVKAGGWPTNLLNIEWDTAA